MRASLARPRGGVAIAMTGRKLGADLRSADRSSCDGILKVGSAILGGFETDRRVSGCYRLPNDGAVTRALTINTWPGQANMHTPALVFSNATPVPNTGPSSKEDWYAGALKYE